MLARVLYTFLVSVLLEMTLQPFASFSVAAQASRGTKVALVIGNNRYDQLAELRNPKRDAAAISDRLRARGFNVSELTRMLSLRERWILSCSKRKQPTLPCSISTVTACSCSIGIF
jgi:Caspase domain